MQRIVVLVPKAEVSDVATEWFSALLRDAGDFALYEEGRLSAGRGLPAEKAPKTVHVTSDFATAVAALLGIDDINETVRKVSTAVETLLRPPEKNRATATSRRAKPGDCDFTQGDGEDRAWCVLPLGHPGNHRMDTAWYTEAKKP